MYGDSGWLSDCLRIRACLSASSPVPCCTPMYVYMYIIIITTALPQTRRPRLPSRSSRPPRRRSARRGAAPRTTTTCAGRQTAATRCAPARRAAHHHTHTHTHTHTQTPAPATQGLILAHTDTCTYYRPARPSPRRQSRRSRRSSTPTAADLGASPLPANERRAAAGAAGVPIARMRRLAAVVTARCTPNRAQRARQTPPRARDDGSLESEPCAKPAHVRNEGTYGRVARAPGPWQSVHSPEAPGRRSVFR
jgi:hypothetical protein